MQGGDPQFAAMLASLPPEQQQLYLQQMQINQFGQNGYMNSQYGPAQMGGMPMASNYSTMANMYATSSYPPAAESESKPLPEPPAPKKEKLKVKLRPEERGIYSSLFDVACTKGSNKVEGKDGVDFLKRSGLDKEILKKIWTIAAQPGSISLNKEEFYIALRLVALAQAGKEVSPQAITMDIPASPPKFEAPAGRSNGSETNINAYSQRPSESRMQSSIHPESSKYSITELDVDKYSNIFIKVDTEQKGYLDASQMEFVVNKLNIPKNMQNLLFTIADETGTGMYSKPVAIIVMHLAVLASNGINIPTSIPTELLRVTHSILGISMNTQPRRVVQVKKVVPTMQKQQNDIYPVDGQVAPTNAPYNPQKTTSTRKEQNGVQHSSASSDEFAMIIKKELEERKENIEKLKEEEADVKRRLDSIRDYNKNLNVYLLTTKDNLNAIQKSLNDYKTKNSSKVEQKLPPAEYNQRQSYQHMPVQQNNVHPSPVPKQNPSPEQPGSDPFGEMERSPPVFNAPQPSSVIFLLIINRTAL